MRTDAKGIPAEDIGVERDGMSAKKEGQGGSVELERPATERSVLPMASASKMVAEPSTGMVQAQGKLGPDVSLPCLSARIAGLA